MIRATIGFNHKLDGTFEPQVFLSLNGVVPLGSVVPPIGTVYPTRREAGAWAHRVISEIGAESGSSQTLETEFFNRRTHAR